MSMKIQLLVRKERDIWAFTLQRNVHVCEAEAQMLIHILKAWLLQQHDNIFEWVSWI